MALRIEIENPEFAEKLPPGKYNTKTLGAEWIKGDMVITIRATNEVYNPDNPQSVFPLTKEDPDVARGLDQSEPGTPYFPSQRDSRE